MMRGHRLNWSGWGYAVVRTVMNIVVSYHVRNSRTIRETNKRTSIDECSCVAYCPQTCFANNVAIFRVVRKGIQMYLQYVPGTTQYIVYRAVWWFDRHTLVQQMAAFGLTRFPSVFLTSSADFACWTFSSLISSQLRALVIATANIWTGIYGSDFITLWRHVSAIQVPFFRVEIWCFIILLATFLYTTTRIAVKQNYVLTFHANLRLVLISPLPDLLPDVVGRHRVSLERGVCSRAELQAFSCYRGWKKARQATRAISTTLRRET
jgi:hypothetical protein